MLHSDEFLCKDCQEFIDLSLGKPYQDSSQMLICSECVKKPKYTTNNLQGLGIVDKQTLINLKGVTICSTCHPASQAYYFNDSNCKMICRQCNPNNFMRILDFEKRSPKYKLKLLLEECCNSNNYDKKYRQRWKNMLNNSAEDIYKCLVEKHFFDKETPICTDHIEEAEFYDKTEFKFKCRLCNFSGGNIVLYNQSLLILKLQCLNIIKLAKTEAFNSYIINAVFNNNFDKNFFYAMKNFNSEKNCDLSANSNCLFCYEKFGLGIKLPISLHDDPLHEICCKCFYDKRPSYCPIDNSPISTNIQIRNFQELYKIKSKSCCGDHGGVKIPRFSYYRKIYPYNICCKQCICTSCLEEGKKVGGIICSQCNLMKSLNGIGIDDNILYQLKFLEMPCENHSHLTALYFDSKNIKLYCDSCMPIPVAVRKELLSDKFENELLRRINLMQIHNSQLITKIKNYYYYYPLIVKFRAYKFCESCVTYLQNKNTGYVQPLKSTVMRFSYIIPLRLTSILKWYVKQDAFYQMNISCRGELELSGLVVGRPISNKSQIKVLYNNIMLAEDSIDIYFNEGQTTEIDFNMTVPISYEPITLMILLNSGHYCHGDTKSMINDLNFNEVPIYVTSSKEYGNLEIGGPIVGFKFIGFHISEAEDPNKNPLV